MLKDHKHDTKIQRDEESNMVSEKKVQIQKL